MSAPPPHAGPVEPVICISLASDEPGPTRLRVQLAAATEMEFDLVLGLGVRYEEALADVCHVAPAMLAYDAALMDAGDEPTSARVALGPINATRDFAMKWRRYLVNVSVQLPVFARLVPVKGEGISDAARD